MNPITNHAQVRALALEMANQRARRIYGREKFCRLGQEFFDAVDAEVRELVRRRAAEHWQKGVTLR